MLKLGIPGQASDFSLNARANILSEITAIISTKEFASIRVAEIVHYTKVIKSRDASKSTTYLADIRYLEWREHFRLGGFFEIPDANVPLVTP
jgi:hypothetical protein